MYVGVELLHKFLGRQSGIRLEEHECHLAFRIEVRFATDFSAWYRVNQTEPDGHLTQRKEGMKASEFTLFERLFIIFVKIKLCERKTWCYFRKLLYLCHDDYFSFPPKQATQSSLGDFLLSYAKIQKIYNTGNQVVIFVWAKLRQSLNYTNHVVTAVGE